jgi:hypothetical protein
MCRKLLTTLGFLHFSPSLLRRSAGWMRVGAAGRSQLDDLVSRAARVSAGSVGVEASRWLGPRARLPMHYRRVKIGAKQLIYLQLK